MLPDLINNWVKCDGVVGVGTLRDELGFPGAGEGLDVESETDIHRCVGFSGTFVLDDGLWGFVTTRGKLVDLHGVNEGTRGIRCFIRKLRLADIESVPLI
jgi:hypothetical protein